MHIMGEKSLSAFVKQMLDLIFIGGIGICLSLPKTVNWYLSYIQATVSINIYYFLLGLLAITGIFALIIVYEIRKIFAALTRKDPFMMDNVRSLKRMGIASFLIAFCYIFKVIFFNSFMTIILIMVFTIAGFFSIILAEVFHQAVIVKEENDFTI
ncbi:MAG: hypothetical protein K0R93_915 [Anaerosolibacter sp.]|nr:hypothetical protein [Anaerosolibacter sp.]